MALEASAMDLEGPVLLHTVGLASPGLALGTTAARALASALGSLLFGVTSGDPVAFLGVGGLPISVAVVAGYVPARRASRIDPMGALRAN